ncbi:MAG: hypothetical protein Q8927_08805 [Bacteroidota bacterium]|nr:hypothetical protein [Bacteroidota bacterium]MDP4216289.1 hypothetical protein [Bacteroidota bacterium]MDP4244454.1 hypothetical protein [Bacteroidota bacterium]MDP4255206.1 hypothetical protein [Bacteroidota bacterium]MDP4258183.1 hypothetical protein [Bacteroidota bacterium]
MKNLIKQLLPAGIMLLFLPAALKAQTDEDGIMMAKKNLCIGGTYSYSSWNNYWEGTFKRTNQNIGTVSTKMFGLMGTYGITNKLNLVAGVPYIETRATAGTLHSQAGFQDLSAWLKWQAFQFRAGEGKLSLYAVGGGSLPLTNYIADYLPLSIGLQSKTLSGRILADYLLGKFFVTASGTYTWRSNITIDRNSYYTTEEHLTNQVDMPDFTSWNVRTGYRSNSLVVEAVLSNMTTIGGFDIRKNDMPFPSNKMNATMLGGAFKYYIKGFEQLSIVGGGSYTVAGRNVGQSTMFDIGAFYIVDFTHARAKKRASSLHNNKTN